MKVRSSMDVFAGLDVGFKDPTAMCVIAYDWDEDKYYLVDEYFNAERTTEQHAEEIQKLIQRWDIDFIYIDSAAQQTRFDFAQNFDISTINAKKSVLDGISQHGFSHGRWFKIRTLLVSNGTGILLAIPS